MNTFLMKIVNQIVDQTLKMSAGEARSLIKDIIDELTMLAEGIVDDNENG